MDRVLLVKDSHFFGSSVKSRLEAALQCEVFWTKTCAETQALLEQGADYFAGVLDYTLPDASNGEVIDLVLSMGVPSIVFSGVFNDDARDYIWSRGVVDYVLKKRPESIDYVLALIRHLAIARDIKILVVDDSRVYRQAVLDLLKVRQYSLLEASDGKEALQMASENPDIKMVITDYYMPEMDGIELTSELRKLRGREDLAIAFPARAGAWCRPSF